MKIIIQNYRKLENNYQILLIEQKGGTKNNNKNNETSESEEEREFTFEERLRVEHLDKKREGMQKRHLKI